MYIGYIYIYIYIYVYRIHYSQGLVYTT